MNENTLSRDYYGMRRYKKTHIIIMATIKTDMICNIRGSYDDWRELLHFIFDAGSVVFN